MTDKPLSARLRERQQKHNTIWLVTETDTETGERVTRERKAFGLFPEELDEIAKLEAELEMWKREADEFVLAVRLKECERERDRLRTVVRKEGR